MKVRMLTMLAFSAVMLAQDQPGPRGAAPQPKTDEVKAFLALTDDQIQSLTQLRRQEMEATRSVRQEIVQKARALHEQIRNGSTDAAALGQLLLDIANLRKQIAQTQSKFHDQAVNLLTADQKTKLQTLADALKLQPAIHEAIGLQLLTPPAHEGGFPGFGPGGLELFGLHGPDEMELGVKRLVVRH